MGGETKQVNQPCPPWSQRSPPPSAASGWPFPLGTRSTATLPAGAAGVPPPSWRHVQLRWGVYHCYSSEVFFHLFFNHWSCLIQYMYLYNLSIYIYTHNIQQIFHDLEGSRWCASWRELLSRSPCLRKVPLRCLCALRHRGLFSPVVKGVPSVVYECLW